MTIDEIKRYTDDEELLKKAEGYLKEIEEDGSCESKYNLALLLQELNNKNLEEEVFDLFKEAAEDGTDADALLQLAILYEAGKGCKKDIVKSFACCYKAVEFGNLDAEFFLAQIFRDDSKRLARYWAEHAANQNHPQAIMEAARMLDSLGASSRNGKAFHDAATRYYEKAAAMGIESAKSKTTLLGKLWREIQ